jgi:hypothetical protein
MVVAMSISALGRTKPEDRSGGRIDDARGRHCGALLLATYGLLGEDLDGVFGQIIGQGVYDFPWDVFRGVENGIDALPVNYQLM